MGALLRGHVVRRARKRENGGILSKGLSDRLFKLQKGKCPCCNQPLGENYHLDHVLPLALGGTKTEIRAQFLYESVLISLLGAVAGIISGVLLGNVVAVLLKTGFVVPWAWVIAGIFVCSFVGLAAGLYPAYKASKLDPIVALRYE